MSATSAVPWQVTGNHWITLPCIHPADASIHAVGAVFAELRGAVEFAGDAAFLEGRGSPLLRITLEVNGVRAALGAEGIAWERESGWIPTFSCRVGNLNVRGVICAPHGRQADVAGAVIALTVENRGDSSARVLLGAEGMLGHRQLRVRTPRAFDDDHVVRSAGDGVVVIGGKSAGSPMSIAIGGEGDFDVAVSGGSPSWSLSRAEDIAPAETSTAAIHVAVGSEPDGAVAALRAMRRRGSTALIADTRSTLRAGEPATGNATADRLIARHAYFCYFGSLARALDESHWYVVRSRIPWNDKGLTVRDWEALMWVLPAVTLVDQVLAREILLRTCELHGYEPGGGLHYLDGSMFEAGFSLEGASSFAVAVDEYIVQTSDEKIVEEAVIAESLYGSQEDIEARRHPQYPLYSTEVNPDGSVPRHAYTAHGNAIAALALDILRHTLDEKTAEKVQDPAAVRAALMRHFSEGQSKATLRAAVDLAGGTSSADEPSASLYWLPYFDLMPRDDSVYRRTVKPLDGADAEHLILRCARLLGPSGNEAFDWLRRAPLDGGLAAELVDADGRAVAGGGDAALSGLVATTLWYAVHALGVKA
jgi:hypothetical protein